MHVGRRSHRPNCAVAPLATFPLAPRSPPSPPAPPPPFDPFPPAAGQAIDDQVEQLASGAAKALSSLWGGLSTVARGVAVKVEAATKEIAQEIVGDVRAAST